MIQSPKMLKGAQTIQRRSKVLKKALREKYLFFLYFIQRCSNSGLLSTIQSCSSPDVEHHWRVRAEK